MSDIHTGILRPEIMLRTAQAEINELRTRLAQAEVVIKRLSSQLEQATLSFCAVVLQSGGTATIQPDELVGKVHMARRVDPATHVVTWTVTREAERPKLEVVQ